MFDKFETFVAKPSRSTKQGSKPGNRANRSKDNSRSFKKDKATINKGAFNREKAYKEEGEISEKRESVNQVRSFRKAGYKSYHEGSEIMKKERPVGRKKDNRNADFKNNSYKKEDRKESNFKDRGSEYRKEDNKAFKGGEHKVKNKRPFEDNPKPTRRAFSKKAVSKANALKRVTIPDINKSKNKAINSKIIEELGLKGIFADICSHHGSELYDLILVKEQGEYILRLIIEGSQPVSLELCANISLEISDWLDEYEANNGDIVSVPYNLEVSSAGDLRHLKSEKDFLKYLNKVVFIETISKMDDENNKGRRKFNGIISNVKNGVVTINVTKENAYFDIEIEDIRKAYPNFEIE